MLTTELSGRLAALLQSRQDEIIKNWLSNSQQMARGQLTEAELRRDMHDVLTSLISALRSDEPLDLTGSAATELRAVLTDLSGSRARRGFTPRNTASAVFGLKEAVAEVVDTTNAAALADFLEFSRLVDEMGLHTFETYTQTREKLMVEQSEHLLELSTPVIKLWEGVMAVPLVGTLDSARAQVVMEKLLQTLVDTSSSYAIIDITGVPAVDTQVAQHILRTVMAARLMGAECIISGIRPQIAQTVVSLGIEFGDIVTKATLADALRHTLHSSGVQIGGRRMPNQAG